MNTGEIISRNTKSRFKSVSNTFSFPLIEMCLQKMLVIR